MSVSSTVDEYRRGVITGTDNAGFQATSCAYLDDFRRVSPDRTSAMSFIVCFIRISGDDSSLATNIRVPASAKSSPRISVALLPRAVIKTSYT